MMESYPISLDEVNRQMARATVDLKHPFRWPALATASLDSEPRSRIVVLRRISKEELEFYTDTRSAKYAHIKSNPAVELLFFDPGKLLQIRVSGKAEIVQDEIELTERWTKLPEDRQREYQTVNSPGARWSSETSQYDEYLGMRYFAVIRVTALSYDALRLRGETHIRQRFSYIDGQWLSERIIP